MGYTFLDFLEYVLGEQHMAVLVVFIEVLVRILDFVGVVWHA